MKKRTALILLILIATVTAVLGLIGCSVKSGNFSNYTPVRFIFNYDRSLDGGRYQNSRNPVTYYYDLKSGESTLISDPETISGDNITYTGYSLEGWYREKEFKNKWDFEKDLLEYDPGVPYEYDTQQGVITNSEQGHGVILYAHWVADINYSFVVCYVDENGAEQILGSYENVSVGQEFYDYKGFYKRDGYTKVRYYGEDGQTIEELHFAHPGGDTDTAIKIYVEYIEGNYTLVRTASEWSLSESTNIYLLNDIDFKGAKVSPLLEYRGIFNGAGHKVSNFTISYLDGRSELLNDPDLADDINSNGSNILAVSLFGNLDGATIQNVTFENATVNLDTSNSLIRQIIISPLALKVKNSLISDVKFSGTYIQTKIPNGFNTESLSISDGVYYFKPDGDNTEVKNTTYSFGPSEKTLDALPAIINYCYTKKKSIKE